MLNSRGWWKSVKGTKIESANNNLGSSICYLASQMPNARVDEHVSYS